MPSLSLMYSDAIQNDEQINRLIASIPRLHIANDPTEPESPLPQPRLNENAGPRHPSELARTPLHGPRTFSATLEDYMDPVDDDIIAATSDMGDNESVLEGTCLIQSIFSC